VGKTCSQRLRIGRWVVYFLVPAGQNEWFLLKQGNHGRFCE
jgi:hypothetical protein